MTDAERQAVLDSALSAPTSQAADGASESNRNLTELQDAVSRERQNSAASKNHRGIRFSRFTPCGTGANG